MAKIQKVSNSRFPKKPPSGKHAVQPKPTGKHDRKVSPYTNKLTNNAK